MSEPSALSYRVVAPLSNDQRAGRCVATWVPVACIVLAASWSMQMFNSGTRYGYSPSLIPVWLEVLIRSAHWVIHLGSAAVVFTSLGLILRGERFRRWCVAGLLVLMAGLLLLISGRIVGHVAALVKVIGRGNPKNILDLAGGLSGFLIELLLPALAVFLLTRSWVREALTEGVAETTRTGLRVSASVGIASGAAGLLSLLLPLLHSSGRTRHSDASHEFATSLPYFSPTWISIATVVLAICSAASLVGGVLLLRRQKTGASLLVGQAIVAIIINATHLTMAIGLVIALDFGDSVSATAVVITRLASLAIDFGLWMYLGSERTRRLLAQGKLEPQPEEAHVASVA